MARLGDVCVIFAGQGAPQGDNNYCDYRQGIPFVKAGDLSDLLSGKSENELQCVNDEVAKKYKLKLYPSGSILFAKSGMSCMKGYVYRTQYPCYIVSHLAIVVPQKVDGEYLKFYFQYHKPNSLIKDSAYPSISLQDISNIELKLPSNEEQEAIAANLNKISELISLRKQQLSKLDELVKSRFIELFGDPEDSTTKWERTTFSSVCIDMHQGINTVADKVEYVNSGFPIIQSKNITSGYLDLEDVRYVTESDYEYYRNKYNPKPSDLLVCNIGTIGKSLIVENEVNFLIAWNLFLIKLNKELVSPIFVKVFIELLNQQNYFEKYMTGGTVKFVNKKTMGNISTPLPPMALQEQFATFVEQTDKSKLAIQKSLEKLETLKKALMQKYFG